jgi:hypothetical protein
MTSVTSMCRSITTLRPPYQEHVTNEDIHAAALQYVRKVSGFHRPAAHNEAAFDAAVAEVTATTQVLLKSLVVKGAGNRTAPEPAEDPASRR